LLAPLTAGFAYFHIEFVAPILYETLRISYIRPVFADLRTVLIAIDCEDVTSMGSLITCDYRGGNNAFIYPSILLKLRTLGISEFFTFGIFITCLILFLLAIKFIYESQNIKKPAFFLSFLTPPFFLVFDRLNLDIVIVTILIFSVYFFNKNLFTLPVALISLTALLKFYTLPLLFICFLLAKTKRRLITCLISVIGVLILLGEDLFKAPGSVGADINGSYGLPVLLSHYSGLSFASLNQNFWVYLHFLMIFGLAYLILHVSFAKQLIVDLRRSRTITLFTLFFTLIHFSTWLTSSNYPYRFVFLLFFSSQILIFSIREEIKIFLFFTILYTTFLSPATMGYLQNLLLVPISAFCLLLIIQSLKIVCSRNGLGDVGHVVRSQ
jgi:hypothetical protein